MNAKDFSPEIHQLIETVQHNCHLSDAKHAGDYTLCVYLLKMREYFRWEEHHPFKTELSTDDIGDWLTQREGLWDEIEQQDYKALTLGGKTFDAFDADGINALLKPQGLVYSGGLGFKAKPHFFLGRLGRTEAIDDFHILVSEKEFARDLTSPPAMSLNNTIYIRRESFRRLIWERTEEWRWNKPENAMARAIACYDFEADLEKALDEMTDNELEATILHEIGEIKAGRLLPDWATMMSDIIFTPAEIMARAVRDHLADSLSTLPRLLKDKNQASIHFYFSNLTAMRKQIFPKLISAYESWLTDNNTDALEAAITHSSNHWESIGKNMLALHQSHKSNCSEHIVQYVNDHNL